MGNRNLIRGRSWRRAVKEKAISYALRRIRTTENMIPNDHSTWTDSEEVQHSLDTWDAVQVYQDVRAHTMADNMTVCSCWMCGNPRKWNGDLSLDERKAILAENEGREELGLPSIISNRKLF